jgi:nicotinamidase/pyrazinamidase
MRIRETQQADPVVLGETAVPAEWLQGREFLLLKKTYDPFTNPNADPLLELLDPEEIVLFGVATDVCNDAAIRSLLARGRVVTFAEDASRGIDEVRTAACTLDWRERGVQFGLVDDLVARL